MKYVIDRSKWVCGAKHKDVLGMSRLLNNMGRMCCLGQVCIAEGANEYQLQGVGTPLALNKQEHINTGSDLNNIVPRWLVRDNMHTTEASEMMEVNDISGITQKERESKLKALAKKAGHTLTFKGRLLPVKGDK